MSHGDNPQATLIAGKRSSVRTLAYNALRFASVLIGAGLLLRTASSEYAFSAQQETKRQPGSQQPEKLAPARLVLPQPAFGNPAPTKQKRHAVRELAVTEPAHVMKSQAAKAEFAPVLAEKVPEAARPEAAAPPAAKPRPAEKPALALAAFEKPGLIAARRPQAAAGLLAPVQIVSGPPVSRAPAVPLAIAPSVAASRPTAAEPVQISLAPPAMRPGPRTTALSSDVRAEMRRPASAWDYAEALPPELQGHTGTRQQQAELEPAAPVAAPASAQPLRLAHSGQTYPEPAPRRTRISAAPAEPARVTQHQLASPPVASSQPKVALTPASGEPSAPCPAALAAQSPQLPVAPAAAMRVARSAPRRRLRELDQRDRVGAVVPPPDAANGVLSPCQQGSTAGGGAIAAQSRGYLTEPERQSALALADASGSDGKGPSLRNRIPHPAF